MLTTEPETLVLARAKRGLRPSASQRRQTLTRLNLAFESLPAAALGELLAPQPSMPREPLAQSPSLAGTAPAAASRFSRQAMVLGVLTGALVGFGAGVMATSVDVSPGAPAPSSSHAAPSVEHAPPAIDEAPRAELAARPERRAPAARTPVVQRKSVGTAAPPARPPLEPHANSAPAEATFYEELSYVRRAQSALQQGNAILALGLMRSLDEMQPSGALMAERNMTRVLALCQLDRTAEAVAVARGMLSGDRAADVYRRRLAGSCAGPSLEQSLTHSDEQESVKDSGDRNTKLSNSKPTGHQQD